MHRPSRGVWQARLKHLWKLVGLWIRLPYFPFVTAWRIGGADDCLRIHRWATAAAYRYRPSLRWLACLVAGAAWPVKSLLLIRRFSRLYGGEVRALTGKPIARQASEQLRLAVRHMISPYEYYMLGLYRPSAYREPLRFLYPKETSDFLRALNHPSRGESMRDKVGFADRMLASGLPAVPPLAWTQDGALRFYAAEDAGLPDRDLFIKPIGGFGGAGAMLWEYVGNGMYGSASARYLCAAAGMKLPELGQRVVLHRRHLCDLLVKLSAIGELMVQPRLLNHRDLADLSTGALLCARVLTGACDAHPLFIRAVLKMPLADSITVNFGLLAPIDEQTGALGMATGFGAQPLQLTHHPDTGARITGRTVPEWPTIRTLAVEAHRAFPEYTFIGWDIAVTPEGVVVLEGNAGWGSEALQKAHGRPLLESSFLEISLARIRQLGA